MHTWIVITFNSKNFSYIISMNSAQLYFAALHSKT